MKNDPNYEVVYHEKTSNRSNLSKMLFGMVVFFMFQFFIFLATGSKNTFDEILDKGQNIYHTCEEYIRD